MNRFAKAQCCEMLAEYSMDFILEHFSEIYQQVSDSEIIHVHVFWLIFNSPATTTDSDLGGNIQSLVSEWIY